MEKLRLLPLLLLLLLLLMLSRRRSDAFPRYYNNFAFSVNAIKPANIASLLTA